VHPFRLIALFAFFFIELAISAQQPAMERIVLHKYPNGKPKMVVYVFKGTTEVVKEEAYFEDGKLDFVGTFQDGLESGVWKYYWPNGILKTEEHYENGMEQGECRYFTETGQLVRFVLYDKGEPVKVIKYQN
jgi:antitoxin component YwqK of YwqJK toxin-antitoxin module